MIDGAGPFRILRSVILPLSDPGHHRGLACSTSSSPGTTSSCRCCTSPASRSCSRCRSRSSSTTRCTSTQPTLIQAAGADDDGRAGRRLLPRPARVHARAWSSPASTSDRVRGDRPEHPVASPGGGRWACPAPRPATRGSTGPMIDDGTWAGVPIGGLGTGSIGRTHRGDFARWHLEVGQHAFAPVAADAFSVFVGAPGEAGSGRATVLSTLRPDALPALGLDPAGGRRHVPRALPAGLAVVRARRPRRPPRRRAAEPGHRRRPRVRARCPLGVFEWWVENPGRRAADRRDHADAGRTRRRRSRPCPRPGRGVARDRRNPRCRRGDPPRPRRCSVGSARDVRHRGVPRARRDRHDPRSRFDAVADAELWADFAADGRLDPIRRPPAERRRRGDRRGRGRDRGAGARRAAVGPVRLAWDLPDGRVRSRAALVEALHPRLGPDRRAGVRPRAACPREQAPAWRDGDRGLAAAGPRSDDRPDWYKAALFNELYFLVDGGTLLGGRRGRRPGAATDRPTRAGSRSSSASTTRSTTRVDVDFYASFAILRLFPELEARGIRDLLAAVPVDDPEIVTIEASGLLAARARSAGPFRTTSVGRTTTRSTARTAYRFQDVNDWKDLGPQVRAPGLARRGRRRCRRATRSSATPGRPSTALLTRLSTRDRDGDGLPEHDGLPDQTYDTWPMHGPVGVRRLALAGRPGGRRGDGRAARARPRPRGAGRAGSSAARSPSTGGCGAATTTPTTTAAARARTASWPTSWRASGTPTRPGSATCCRADRVEARAADDPPDERLRLRRRADGRGQRDAARTARSTTRASSRRRSGSGRPTRWPRS